MGAHASARGGTMRVQEWPEDTIELGRVMLTPASGPNVWTARHRQTAV